MFFPRLHSPDADTAGTAGGGAAATATKETTESTKSPLAVALGEFREQVQKDAAAVAGTTAGTTAAAVEDDDEPDGAGDDAAAAAAVEGDGKDATAAAGEAEPEGEGTDDPEPAAELVVEIPARNADGKPVKITLADKEQADLVRSAIRGGIRRDQLKAERAELTAREEQLGQIVDHLQVDPVGFITGKLESELQIEVARHLLSIPAVFDEIAKEIEDWANPDVMGRRQAELRGDRVTRKETAQQEVAARHEAREAARMVGQTIADLVPEGTEAEEAEQFHQDCINDLQAHVKANPQVKSLRQEEIVRIVGRRLRPFGVTPEAALAALSSGQPTRRPPAAAGSKTPAAAEKVPDADTARTTGAKLKEASDRRRAAAAVPGAGAGAKPTVLQPPPKQGVKGTIAFLRNNLPGFKKK